MTIKEIQDEVITQYRIKIDEHSKCWSRMHAHIKERRICKWHQKASLKATFDLFHEIGHIETTKSTMRRCESEYYATEFAIRIFKQYGLEVPENTRQVYQEYIWRELDRGIRRGGQNYPTKEALTLTK
jgi:hypothetical protein